MLGISNTIQSDRTNVFFFYFFPVKTLSSKRLSITTATPFSAETTTSPTFPDFRAAVSTSPETASAARRLPIPSGSRRRRTTFPAKRFRQLSMPEDLLAMFVLP